MSKSERGPVTVWGAVAAVVAAAVAFRYTSEEDTQKAVLTGLAPSVAVLLAAVLKFYFVEDQKFAATSGAFGALGAVVSVVMTIDEETALPKTASAAGVFLATLGASNFLRAGEQEEEQ